MPWGSSHSFTQHPSLPALGLQAAVFKVGTRELNSGPHTCTSRTFIHHTVMPNPIRSSLSWIISLSQWGFVALCSSDSLLSPLHRETLVNLSHLTQRLLSRHLAAPSFSRMQKSIRKFDCPHTNSNNFWLWKFSSSWHPSLRVIWLIGVERSGRFDWLINDWLGQHDDFFELPT